MKKTNLLLLIFFSIAYTTCAYAQIELQVGKPYTVVDARTKMYFYENNEMLSVKIDGRKVVIQKMSTDQLTQLSKKTYEDFPDKFTYEHIIQYDGYICLFYSVYDKPNETEQLFYRKIAFKDGIFVGAGIRILAVNKKLSYYSFNSSYDKSKLMIQYRLKAETRNDDKSFDIIGFNMFNEKLDLLWAKEVTMPYTEKKMDNLDFSVDTEGNAYMLAKVYNDNTTDDVKRGKEEANYHLELLKFKAQTTELSISQISLQEKFINDIAIYNSPKDYLFCTGTYNKKANSDAVDGVFVFKVTEAGKIYDLSTHEIPLEIINQYISEKDQRKNEKRDDKKGDVQLRNLDLDKIVVEEDGSILLVAERFHIESRTVYYSNGSSNTTYYYHYDDMLLTKIDPNGNLLWMKKLPKRQVGGASKGGMSYKFIAEKNNYYMLYLDNVKNMNLTVDQAPEYHKDGAGGFLTAYQVSKDKGAVNKISVLDTRDVNGIEIYQFAPSRILPLEENKIILEFYKKGKEDLLIKATLKD